MLSGMEVYQAVEEIALANQVKIRFKDESYLMRLLGFLLFFNKGFMTEFTTTLGDSVYFTSRERVRADPQGAAATLAHELVHIFDGRDMGQIVYTLTYLSPQCFAVLSVLALLAIPFSLWWLISLSSLVMLAPWEAPGRASIEFRGYAMTLATAVWSGRKYDHIPPRMIEQFTGFNYYRMDPDHAHVVKVFRDWLVDIETGAVHQKLPQPLTGQLQSIFSQCKAS